MTPETQTLGKTLLDGLKENAGSAIGIGIFLLIAGVSALGAPFVTGISITLMIGVLMIVGGIAQCILAFKVGAFGRGVLVFLMGVLMVVVDGYTVSQASGYVLLEAFADTELGPPSKKPFPGADLSPSRFGREQAQEKN